MREVWNLASFWQTPYLELGQVKRFNPTIMAKE